MESDLAPPRSVQFPASYAPIGPFLGVDNHLDGRPRWRSLTIWTP